MNDEFIKQTTEYIKQFVSDEYEVMNSTTQKNNGVVLHGVSIRNKNERLSPVFYLDGYEGMEPEVAAQQIIERYREVKQKEIPFDVDTITDFSKVKEMICYKLVNLEANKDMLMDMPYDEVAGDIGLIYYLDLGNDATITIKEGKLIYSIVTVFDAFILGLPWIVYVKNQFKRQVEGWIDSIGWVYGIITGFVLVLYQFIIMNSRNPE